MEHRDCGEGVARRRREGREMIMLKVSMTRYSRVHWSLQPRAGMHKLSASVRGFRDTL